MSSNVQFVAKSNVTSPIVLLTLDFNGFTKINLKAKKRLIFFFFFNQLDHENIKVISTNTHYSSTELLVLLSSFLCSFTGPDRRPPYCSHFHLLGPAAERSSRNRGDSADNNNVYCSYEEASRHLGNNKLVHRHLSLLSVCFPSKSWRRRHSTSTGQAECIHLLCSLCVRSSSGSKLTVWGQEGS